VSITASAAALLADVDEWIRSDTRAIFVCGVTAQLLAIERTSVPLSAVPQVRVQTRTGGWITISASRLPCASDTDHIALVVEPTRDEELVPLLLAAYALTHGEERVVLGVLAGASSKEIAHALGITPQTVQQHLKRIFEKLTVHSRGELRARLQAQRYRLPCPA
jgi:DNA-binding CsgD family transcriptional regulator